VRGYKAIGYTIEKSEGASCRFMKPLRLSCDNCDIQLSASVSASVEEVMMAVNCAKLLKNLMRPARLERATFWFVAKRSIQLSYGRI
jgi:hypothetical protein